MTDLQHADRGQHAGGWQTRAAHNLIQIRRVGGDGVEHLTLLVIELQFGRMPQRVSVVLQQRLAQRPEFLQHIVDRFHQLGAIPNQPVAAA